MKFEHQYIFCRKFAAVCQKIAISCPLNFLTDDAAGEACSHGQHCVKALHCRCITVVS